MLMQSRPLIQVNLVFMQECQEVLLQDQLYQQTQDSGEDWEGKGAKGKASEADC